MAIDSELIGFVPARAGSERIRGKNVRLLEGHPVLAYAIASALESGIFSRVIVSTDSEEYARIARHYGAEVPFMRPAEYATSESPDIEWILYTLDRLSVDSGVMAILRPTSPFRGAQTLRRAWAQLQEVPEADSLRAVRKVREHPGKMWTLSGDGRTMQTLLDQSHLEKPWHAGQYKSLPEVYVQDSSLEMARIPAVLKTRSREGRVLTPFLTEPMESFALDYEDEWLLALEYVRSGRATLPTISTPPMS